jgi:hypothetical protein
MPINNYTEEELLEICDNLYGQISKKYTIYVTYQLRSGLNSVHCNYIESFNSDSYDDISVNIKLNNTTYLNNVQSGSDLYILVNVVENEKIDDKYVKLPPKSNQWRIYDKGPIAASYDQSLDNYDEDTIYSLDYLNYPEKGEDKLCFGEEVFFLGNITTNIEAIVHSTDLSIKLPLNEYNYSTNKTWDEESSVYITEIGIYDDDDNLVAIGKLSNPLEKNQDILRTIVFAMDF